MAIITHILLCLYAERLWRNSRTLRRIGKTAFVLLLNIGPQFGAYAYTSKDIGVLDHLETNANSSSAHFKDGQVKRNDSVRPFGFQFLDKIKERKTAERQLREVDTVDLDIFRPMTDGGSFANGTCPSLLNGAFDENWAASIGKARTNVNSFSESDFIDGPINQGRHTIITEQGVNDDNIDPTCGSLPTVYPGSDYSIRLGNSNTGSQAEVLRYRMTVDPANSLFMYRYAVVLQDPGHPADQQPAFELMVLDENGDLVNRECGFYEVVASANIEGFKTCGSLVYKEWTTVGLDLSAFADREVSLVFRTDDCTQGGHYGYAYFEPMTCRPFELETNNFCPEESVTLEAPEGFAYLWSNGATTQSVTINNPQPGEEITVGLTSLVNQTCQLNMSYTVPDFKEADIAIESNLDACNREFFFEVDSSTFPGGRIPGEYTWDFGEGNSVSSGSETSISHIYEGSGTFNVNVTITNENCVFSSQTQIEVPIVNVPGIISSDQTICFGGVPALLTEVAPPVADDAVRYQWQESSDGTNFVDLPNADQVSFQPNGLTEDTWYRRMDIFSVAGQNCPISGNSIKITLNRFTQEAILGNEVVVCEGELSPEIVPEQPSIALGVLSYQWQSSSDGENFTDIEGAISVNLSPQELTMDTWFRRMDTSTLNGVTCDIFTNGIKVEINKISPAIIGSEQTICYASVPSEIQVVQPAMPTGNLSVQWQQSADGQTFNDIDGANELSYAPESLSTTTWFRRVDFSELRGRLCSAPTNTVLINVNEQIILPQPMVAPPTCGSNGQLQHGILVSLDSATITGGSGEYVHVDFFWDKNNDGDIEGDPLLQEGSSYVYEQEDYEDRQLLIRVLDNQGCEGIIEAEISGIRPLEVSVIIEQELCSGDENGVIKLQITGGFGPYETALNSDDEMNFQQDRTEFFGLRGGRSYVVHVRDSRGCIERLQLELEAPVDLSAQMDLEYHCLTSKPEHYNTLRINIDPDLVGNTLFTLDSDPATTQMEPVFNDLPPGSHHVTIAHENGCISPPLFIDVLDLDELQISADTSKINTVILSATGGLPDYEFRFGDSGYGSKNEFVFKQSGTYEMGIRDSRGCEQILVMELEFIPIEIPEYFSPNGDGRNDFWSPSNTQAYPMAETVIYDRYGRTIAVLGNTEKWDGYYNNMPLPSGDYWYVLRFNDKELVLDPLAGHFTLFR